MMFTIYLLLDMMRWFTKIIPNLDAGQDRKIGAG